MDEASFIYLVPLGLKELEDFMENEDLAIDLERAGSEMDSFLCGLDIRTGKMTHAIKEGDPARALIDIANTGIFMSS